MADERRWESHPEADQLAAFVEQSLTRGERAELVEHLSGCARCREALFLAQEAAQQTAAGARLAISAGRLPHWLRLTGPVAAYGSALLALGVVSVFWYARVNTGAGPSPGREQAVVTPEPRNAAAPAMTANPERARQDSEKRGATPSSAAQMEKGKKSEAVFRASPALAASSEPSAAASAQPARATEAAVQPEANAILAQPPVVLPAMRMGAPPDARERQREQQRIAQARLQAQSEAEARLTEERYAAGGESSSQVKTAAAFPAVAIQAKQDRSQAPAAAPAGEAASGSFDAMPRVNGVTWKGASEPMDGGAAPTEPAATSPLPGGASVAGTVDLDGRRVALDARGGLFVSLDHGAHWRRIPKQWKGKATMLMLLPEDKAAPAAAPAQARTAAGDSLLLWNDKNLAWKSADGGETWTPFTLRR